jgi:hypothetical protein
MVKKLVIGTAMVYNMVAKVPKLEQLSSEMKLGLCCFVCGFEGLHLLALSLSFLQVCHIVSFVYLGKLQKFFDFVVDHVTIS